METKKQDLVFQEAFEDSIPGAQSSQDVPNVPNRKPRPNWRNKSFPTRPSFFNQFGTSSPQNKGDPPVNIPILTKIDQNGWCTYQPKWDPKTVLTTAMCFHPTQPSFLLAARREASLTPPGSWSSSWPMTGSVSSGRRWLRGFGCLTVSV